MANIKLNNNEYTIPDSVLATHTADFVAYLETIAGNGLKVVVGGVEYGIDATKVTGAVEALEGYLAAMTDEPAEPELGFPITWNTMEVINNFSIPGDCPYVKVSDYVPSPDELKNTSLTMPLEDGVVGDDLLVLKVDCIADEGDLGYGVEYVWSGPLNVERYPFLCVKESKEFPELGGLFLESGFYAPNFGVQGLDFDCVIDIVIPEDSGTDS